ncbi:MAG: YggT family protein [Ilumatobacteraceae bacterium]
MISQLVSLYTFLIFVRIILSWFPMNPAGPLASVTQVLFRITEPVLGPVRRIVPSLGPFDISPIVVVFLLGIVQRVLASVGL